MKPSSYSVVGPVFVLALLGGLAGCATPGGTQTADGQTPPPPAYVQDGFGVLQSDYVFYPAYRVYHSHSRSHFVYQERGAWVSRSKPPGVSAATVFASPSGRAGTGEAPTFIH